MDSSVFPSPRAKPVRGNTYSSRPAETTASALATSSEPFSRCSDCSTRPGSSAATIGGSEFAPNYEGLLRALRCTGLTHLDTPNTCYGSHRTALSLAAALVVTALLLLDPSPTPAQTDPSQPHVELTPERNLLRAAGSALLLKVVGLSDSISIVATPGSSRILSTMEPLKPYFVLDDKNGGYLISSQEEGGIQGFVSKQEVATWNTREGLRFVESTFVQNRRTPVVAWDSEDRIRQYARTGNVKAYGPTFKEETQTRIGEHGIIPYPLLDTKVVKDRNGENRRVHQVLIPAVVAVETNLTREQVRDVAGAVTFCVVFDVTASMGKHAREFAGTIDKMLSKPNVNTDRAAAGFVFFRDLKDERSFEVLQPMPLKYATKELRGRIKSMIGGDHPAEPVLDAVMLAEKNFLWNAGTAIRGARRIVIVVANKAAWPTTIGLTSDIPGGLGTDHVGRSLLQSRISVFALQAGNEDEGNLIEVLSSLAEKTGGEFYRAAVRSEEIASAFSRNMQKVLQKPIDEGDAMAQYILRHISSRQEGGAVIPLNVLDNDMRARLKEAARDYHVSNVGLVITKAWVLDEPNLYREEILIEKELLEQLVNFFNEMVDTSLDPTKLRENMVMQLEALTGENLEEGVELQELLEKRLGIHFTTTLLSFDIDHLPSLDPVKRVLLQEEIRKATAALADFHEQNLTLFNKEPRLWMPVSVLP